MKLLASSFTRNRAVDTALPTQTTLAAVSGIISYNSSTFKWETYAGVTLSATPGTWTDPDGTPSVVRQWYARKPPASLSIFTEPDVYTMTVPESGYTVFLWKEIASQGGKSVTKNTRAIWFAPDPPAPIFNRVDQPITSTNYNNSGSILTAPVFTWTSRLSFVQYGEWYNNGIPTGETGNTYTNTIQGDNITWGEYAIDSLGGQSDLKFSEVFIINDSIDDVAMSIRNEIESRILDLSGGSTNMKIFNIKNHTTEEYTFNPNLWCGDLWNQLAARAVYKTGMVADRPEDYGGILITPKHLLYCGHAHPHAEDTWPYGTAPRCDIRFVLPDGTSITAIQIHQSNAIGVDLCVATLDRDVSVLGVSTIPIFPYDYNTWTTIKTFDDRLPVFSISQGYTVGNEPWTDPASDYPYPDHDVLAYIKNEAYPSEIPNPYRHFDYTVYDGDSGCPAFTIVNGIAYLYKIVTTFGFGGVYVPSYIDEINNAIAQSDANAISLGRLAEPTGYTVELAPFPL